MNWCPKCNAAAEGQTCPDCGGETVPMPQTSWGRSEKIGDLWERWPKDENGEPEPPVFLCHCSCNDMGDKLFLGKMEAYGIPVLTRLPGGGDLGKVILGMAGFGVDMYVPASVVEDARILMKEEPESGEDL